MGVHAWSCSYLAAASAAGVVVCLLQGRSGKGVNLLDQGGVRVHHGSSDPDVMASISVWERIITSSRAVAVSVGPNLRRSEVNGLKSDPRIENQPSVSLRNRTFLRPKVGLERVEQLTFKLWRSFFSAGEEPSISYTEYGAYGFPNRRYCTV